MDIIIPEIGESVFEAVIATWHKADGDPVRRDELICELETDKISLELNAEADGVLRIKAQEGETVPIGAVIGNIEEGEAPAGKTEESPAEEAAEAPADAAAEEPVAEADEKADDEQRPEPEKKEAADADAPESSPEPAKPAPAAPAPPAPSAQPVTTRDFGPVERKPMTPLRKKIAERLLAARQQTAMLTTFNEADMTRVIALRKKHQEHFQSKHGVKLGFMSFFVKACVEALREYPAVNARIDGNDIVYHQYYNIGVAIGTEKGLVVPVLRDADQHHFADIEQAIVDYSQKANSGKLDLSDMEGGTFTISNGGVYGSVLSTPILNPPQSGVLGMHAIKDRPVAIDGQVVVRPIMQLALSYDHRIIDGREAVNFLRTIKEYIEDPDDLLLEM